MKAQLIDATHLCGCEVGYVVVLADSTVAEFKAAIAAEPCRFCREDDEEDAKWDRLLSTSTPRPTAR